MHLPAVHLPAVNLPAAIHSRPTGAGLHCTLCSGMPCVGLLVCRSSAMMIPMQVGAGMRSSDEQHCYLFYCDQLPDVYCLSCPCCAGHHAAAHRQDHAAAGGRPQQCYWACCCLGSLLQQVPNPGLRHAAIAQVGPPPAETATAGLHLQYALVLSIHKRSHLADHLISAVDQCGLVAIMVSTSICAQPALRHRRQMTYGGASPCACRYCLPGPWPLAALETSSSCRPSLCQHGW